MLAKQFIKDVIPPLKMSDTGLKALGWMEEFRVSQLPVIDNNEFIGLISEDDILNLNDTTQPLLNYKLSLIRPFVYDYQHIYDVIKIIGDFKIGIVAILNPQNEYVGVVTVNEIMENFSQIGSIQNPGGIIVLEMNIHDYSMTEIANIVESNNASILSLYITSPVDSEKLEITLKVNKIDLTRILATFDRYNYTVKASFHQSEFSDDMKDRFDSFMNYLNI